MGAQPRHFFPFSFHFYFHCCFVIFFVFVKVYFILFLMFVFDIFQGIKKKEGALEEVLFNLAIFRENSHQVTRLCQKGTRPCALRRQIFTNIRSHGRAKKAHSRATLISSVFKRREFSTFPVVRFSQLHTSQNPRNSHFDYFYMT